MIPFQRLSEIKRRETREYRQRNYFLHRLQLRRRIDARADVVCRHHKAVFEKAMPQDAGISSQIGALGNLSCPYQAKVMKILEMQSRITGATISQFIESPSAH